MKERPKITDRLIQRWITLYTSGYSLSQIGRRFEYRHSTISRHLYKHGIKIRLHYIRKTKIPTNEIIELYKQGFPSTYIAKKSGLSAQAVLERLMKARVKRRPQSKSLKLSHYLGILKSKRGDESPLWKGGRYKDKDGYIRLYINQKTISEHKYIWEKYHRKLKKNWIVHHLNGKRNDNRIENLCAMPRKRHSPILIVKEYRKRIILLENKIEEMKILINNSVKGEKNGKN